ncbi:methyltransferase type 11 [Lucifera butyrica]|uniref:Methyltransferase type 11 n=1 Tax=Lucifera butyrica TaxID=1351585 RepID=A0A498RGL5_9FIRM|nr:class I SAM-dependent methyltransferase [Lucifera butyrica]VBB08258.1 methyltransferase type 11 [Lucifera butyrica]
MDKEEILLQTEIIRNRYNRRARFYDWMDRMIPESVRQNAITQAVGSVLEVGVGTGKNLSLYRPNCEVTGIDFSPAMLAKARQKVHLAKVPVTLMEMDAQHMSFPDGTFDTVVATCVFCSVPDPVQGLREVRRVCKANGKIVLLEHVRSDQPLLGWLMDVLNPVFLRLIGSNINRRTVENVRAAGIEIQQVQDVDGKIVKLIEARP